MTTPSPPPASEPVEPPPPPAWFTAIDYGLRFLCIGVVVWVAWQAVPMVARILGGAKPATEDVARPMDPAAAPRILAAGPLPGPWRMAGSEWEYAVSKVPPDEVDARLAKLADKPTGAPQPVDKTGLDLLQALRVLGAPQEISGGRRLYRAAGQSWKIGVVAQGAGESERILTGAASWRYGAGDWQWLELVPRRDQPAADVPQIVTPSKHLLPLPPGAPVVASRWSTAGELLLEIVSTPLPFSDFEKDWKQAGYALHPARGPAPEALAKEMPAVPGPLTQAWFCVRGEEVVYVWATTQGTRSTLLLARTSAADQAAADPGENPSQPSRESTP